MRNYALPPTVFLQDLGNVYSVCINVALHSQFDADFIPEYEPLPHSINSTKILDKTPPKCSVYIPTFPGSTFWIEYWISPPVPDDQYFLFKLYIDGVHIFNWSTGKEEGWSGKTMFGLYERQEDEEGKKRIEKRVLCFTPPNTRAFAKGQCKDNVCMEIKVHRAHGRKRVGRRTEEYSKTQYAKKAQGIDFINAGRASSEQPKRFYLFALIDPIDRPFVTFRYLYRTWEQLRQAGVLGGEEEENELSVIEPCKDISKDDFMNKCSVSAADDKSNSMEKPSMATSPVKTKKPSTWDCSTSIPKQLRAYVPHGAPRARKEQTLRKHQSESPTSTAYRPHPAPVDKIEDGKQNDQGHKAASFMTAISSSWKRHGA
ncbi:hypothetical protein GQ44DRAFT_831994 [Phaeosphaeriaceae sp. PMI808]|nr:hypothetical protein GQ44DRAFT_831994 [Phaeosphaeriaceae sp. PMI808]